MKWIKATDKLPEGQPVYFGKIKTYIGVETRSCILSHATKPGWYHANGPALSITIEKDKIIEWLDESDETLSDAEKAAKWETLGEEISKFYAEPGNEDGGGYSFLFTTANATEEDAVKVVKKAENGMYYDYVLFRGHLQNYLDNAVEALASLLKSHNLDPSKNWAIIKNNV